MLTRRQFHRRLAAAAAAAASLPALNPRAWAAQTPPRRLFLMFSLGTNNVLWRPTSQPGSPVTMSAACQPLDAVKDHLMLVDGLSFLDPLNQHSTWLPFTGATSSNGGMGKGANNLRGDKVLSVDQYVVAKQPPSTRIRSLQAGVMAKDEGLMFFNGTRMPSNDDPQGLFGSVFQGAMATAPGGAAAGGNIVFPRQSILDQVTGEIKELQSTLGTGARARLDQHLTALEQLEKNAAPIASSGACQPTAPAGAGAGDNSLLATANGKAQLDIIAQAFACDLTRVASLQWGISNKQLIVPTGQSAAVEEHGEGIHAPSDAKTIACEATICQAFADFIATLAKTPEPSGDGMVLDNTLVFWTRDMGYAMGHTMYAVPTVMAGAPGYLGLKAGGAYIRADGDDTSAKKSSITHDALLLNCLEWMGVTDISGFGVNAGATQPFAQVKKA